MDIFHQFVVFLGVGGATSILYFLLLYLFLYILKIQYLVGVSLAYFISIIFHYFTNRQVTFKATSESVKTQAKRYVLFAGFNYLITLGIVMTTVELFGASSFWAALLAVVITTGLGFLVGKQWVFKTKVAIHD